MNKGVIACAFASLIITGPLAYQPARLRAKQQQTSISGKVTPSGEAKVVCMVNGKDSIRAALISDKFFAMVKPGKYKLIINTRNNNKLVQLDNLEVRQNQALDVGEIILQ